MAGMWCCAVQEQAGSVEAVQLGKLAEGAEPMSIGVGDEAVEVAALECNTLSTLNLARMEGQSFGLSVDNLDNRFLLINVDPEGVAAEANRKRKVQQLCRGHFITSVNGTRGNAPKMLKMLKSQITLELEVWKPEPITVTVDRSGPDPAKPRELGLELNYSPDVRALQVLKVTGGAMEEWNSKSDSSRMVKRGDCIQMINGTLGIAKELLGIIKTETLLELQILRPPSFGGSAEMAD